MSRVLFYISSMSSGGAERVVATLSNYWCARGWEVMIVTAAAMQHDFYHLDGRVVRVALDDGCTSWVWMRGPLANLRRIVALRHLLSSFRPDVSIAMMDTANVVLALAASGSRNLVVLGSERVHPAALRIRPIWKLLRWWIYGRLNAVVALTTASALWLRENTRARATPVIPNPIVMPLPRSEPVVPPEAILRGGRKTLLAVGRLTEQKGFDILLVAFRALTDRFPDWDLAIVGDGPLREQLMKRVTESGLDGRVHFAGRVGNLGDWYSCADAFVLSSRFEGFPNTLVEAMAYGVPAASFDCPTGPAEIIGDQRSGLLVPPEDADALAKALARLMGDESLRRSMGRAALEVRERYSIECVSAMWERLFVEVHA